MGAPRADLRADGAQYPAMPPLPVELVSAIIEYFFGERDELGRLALVSKTWAVQSRRLLLRCVRLKVTAEHDAVDAFARFLDAPLGSLSRAHIRHVIVQGIPPDDDDDDEPTVAVHALGEMLVKVPRVASIELHVVKFRGVEAEDPDPPVVWHVQWVHLARVSTWMAHDLKNTMDVLRLFPNLQTFQTCNGRDSPIRDTTADVERPYILPPKRRPFPDIKLTSLRHKIYGPTAPLFDYLARDFDLRYLTTLVLWHIDSWELPSLGKVLAQAKKTLKRFELNLSEVRFWKDRLREYEIFCPGLPSRLNEMISFSEAQSLERMAKSRSAGLQSPRGSVYLCAAGRRPRDARTRELSTLLGLCSSDMLFPPAIRASHILRNRGREGAGVAGGSPGNGVLGPHIALSRRPSPTRTRSLLPGIPLVRRALPQAS